MPKTKSQLLVHETTFSDLDFITDASEDCLGIIIKDDVLIISNGASTNLERDRQNKGKLSIRKDVSVLYGIVPRQLADVVNVKKDDYICSFVEISFRYL